MSTLRLSGILAEPAHSATGVDGSAWVIASVQQHGGGAPCTARQCYGTGHAAQFAAANAVHRLRQGASVTVHASHYRISLAPAPHLVAEGVDLIEQHGLPAHQGLAA